MTCGSERSGMASTFTVRIAQTDASTRARTPTRTTARLRALSSMIRAIIRPSPSRAAGAREHAGAVLVLVAAAVLRLRRLVVGRGAEPADGGAQAALGVEEEVGGGHDPLALGDAGEEGDPPGAAPAGAHPARL